MQAAVWSSYGPPDVLQLQTIDKPAPNDDEILVKVHATTVNRGDCEQRAMDQPLWYSVPMKAYFASKRGKPLILGMELSGIVEDVGKTVTEFNKGDHIVATTGFDHLGTNVEYVCLPVRADGVAIAIKPVDMTFEEAATLPMGGLEALSHLRRGNVKNGDSVLIIGACGTVGTWAIQLAKHHFGCTVSAIDSKGKHDILKDLGADYVYDIGSGLERGTYDLIVDLVSKGSFQECVDALKEHGKYLIVDPGAMQFLRGKWKNNVIFGNVQCKSSDLLYLTELVKAGKLNSIIDRVFPLEKIVDAHRYVESGEKKGHAVISLIS